MSRPEEELHLTSFFEEEVLGNLPQMLARAIEQLPQPVRLRMLAFMHLVENAETLRAVLEVKPTGHLRLTLDTFVSPARSHQH